MIENEEDLKKLYNIFSEDIENLIPEYCDIIKCRGKISYTSSLILVSSDFSIVLIIEHNLTPKNFLKYQNEREIT